MKLLKLKCNYQTYVENISNLIIRQHSKLFSLSLYCIFDIIP